MAYAMVEALIQSDAIAGMAVIVILTAMSIILIAMQLYCFINMIVASISKGNLLLLLFIIYVLVISNELQKKDTRDSNFDNSNTRLFVLNGGLLNDAASAGVPAPAPLVVLYV